jgi:uncharacterized protein (TIGR02466 family)
LNNPTIENLFPTPVYTTELHRKLSKKELGIIKKLSNDVYKNLGNVTSNNKNVLELSELLDLKKDIMVYVEDYMNKIIQAPDNVSSYITQSWLNYTKQNEWHHKHEHPNSYISGVYYVDADEKTDKIFFYNNTYEQINIHPKEWNMYNSKSWWLPVKTNELILFPSHLTHMVEVKAGKNIRTSLAFNTFLKGNLGNSIELTELIL